MQSVDEAVLRYANPYEVATRYSAGDLTQDDLVSILGAWPYESPTDADEQSFAAVTVSPGTFAHVRWAARHQMITLMQYRAVADRAAETYGLKHGVVSVPQLSTADVGRWQINTRHSIHIMDLDQRTVTRIPQSAAAPEIPTSDGTFRLRTLDRCRVQERGRWTMHAGGYLTDHHWAETSLIASIVRIHGDNNPVVRA